jgi:hypothetical protein
MLDSALALTVPARIFLPHAMPHPPAIPRSQLRSVSANIRAMQLRRLHVPRRSQQPCRVSARHDCYRVETAMPFPLIRPRRGARPLDNHPDPNAGIVDVPGHRPVVDALAGEFVHAPLKR